MGMYQGAAPCAGCGVPGNKKWRKNKDGLCNECSEFLTVGRGLKSEYDPKNYTWVFLPWHKLKGAGDDLWGDELESLFTDVCEILHKEGFDYSGQLEMVRREATLANHKYVMQKDVAKALAALGTHLHKQQHEVRKRWDKLESDAKKLLKKERDKVYSAGVEHGKKLLAGLNDGSLTLADFEKNLYSYNSGEK